MEPVDVPPSRTVLWRRVMDDLSFELAQLRRQPDEIEISGLVLIAEHGTPLRVDYRVVCDISWTTRLVEIEQIFQGERRRAVLTHDGSGRWVRDGRDLPELAGCLDVDLGVTPSTNALPINRLALPQGGRAEIDAAWLQFPSLTIVRARQSYERLSPTRYRYRSVSSGFTAEIEVDEHGLPIDYAGIWRRIAASAEANSFL